MAMEVREIAAWQWDLATDQMEWSADPEALFGFPPGAFGPELRIFRRLHPDDVRGCEAAIAAAPRQRVSTSANTAPSGPTSRVVWITERGRIVRGEDGTPQKSSASAATSARSARPPQRAGAAAAQRARRRATKPSARAG